jgi:hypothetical protein
MSQVHFRMVAVRWIIDFTIACITMILPNKLFYVFLILSFLKAITSGVTLFRIDRKLDVTTTSCIESIIHVIIIVSISLASLNQKTPVVLSVVILLWSIYCYTYNTVSITEIYCERKKLLDTSTSEQQVAFRDNNNLPVIGSMWRHYRGPSFKVEGFTMNEATKDMHILYSHEHYIFSFSTPYSEWEEVMGDVDDVPIYRFTQENVR